MSCNLDKLAEIKHKYFVQSQEADLRFHIACRLIDMSTQDQDVCTAMTDVIRECVSTGVAMHHVESKDREAYSSYPVWDKIPDIFNEVYRELDPYMDSTYRCDRPPYGLEDA